MQQNFDEKFLNLYRFVRQNRNSSEFLRFFDFFTIKIYLLAADRAHFSPMRAPLKLIARSLWDLAASLTHLLAILIKSRFDKPFGGIILVYEPSHLSQALGLAGHVKKYNPIYVTTKREYLKVIKEKISGSTVIFIPSLPFSTSKYSKQQVSGLFANHGIDISAKTAADSSTMMNEMVRTFWLTRFYFNALTATGKIKFCYIFNDLTFTGRVIAYLSAKKNIKTFYIMHGLLSDEFIENLHICDYYLVFGDYVRNVLSIKEGITNEKIITIGTPYLNYYIALDEPQAFKTHVKAKVPQGKKVALVLLSGPGHSVSPAHHKSIIAAIKEVIKQKSGSFYFIFKLHPKDSSNNFSALLNDAEVSGKFALYSFNALQNSETIFDWLKVADVVITGASTTALEGMYMKKPIVTIDLMHGFDNDTLFITEGATYHCTSKEELTAVINQLEINGFRPKEKADEIASSYFSDFSYLTKFFSGTMDQLIAR